MDIVIIIWFIVLLLLWQHLLANYSNKICMLAVSVNYGDNARIPRIALIASLSFCPLLPPAKKTLLFAITSTTYTHPCPLLVHPSRITRNQRFLSSEVTNETHRRRDTTNKKHPSGTAITCLINSTGKYAASDPADSYSKPLCC